MGSARSRRAQVATVLILGAAVVGLGVFVWAHRLELFERPRLWRQARALVALRTEQPDHPGFSPSENRGLSPFDVVLSRLIRLERPGFPGGTRFHLLPMQSEAGRRVWLARYDAMDVPFDRPVDPEEEELEVVYFCADGCSPHSLLALDDAGQVLGEPQGYRVLHGFDDPKSWQPVEESEGFTTLRLASRADCAACVMPVWRSFEVLSVDGAGIVRRGRVTATSLAAPVCPRGWSWRAELDALEVEGLLASGRPGDLHRALWRLELAGTGEARRAAPLLTHPDPGLRARAAAIAGQDPGCARRVAALLADPAAQVRFAAIGGVRELPGWEALLLPLTHDADPHVAMRAHRELILSREVELSTRSTVALFRSRDPYITHWNLCTAATPAAAESAVSWLEEDLDAGSTGNLSNLEHSLAIAFTPEVLRPFTSRIVRLHRQREAQAHGWRFDLAQMLVKVDEPIADEALMQSLAAAERDDDHPGGRMLKGLLTRETPIRAASSGRVLEQVLRSGGPCRECDLNDCQTAAALLLLRSGSWEGLAWLVAKYWRTDDGGWPLAALVSWIEQAYEEARRDCVTESTMSGLPQPSE